MRRDCHVQVVQLENGGLLGEKKTKDEEVPALYGCQMGYLETEDKKMV